MSTILRPIGAIQHVKVLPSSQRAKNRVAEHGETMRLLRKGDFKGEPAVLLESLEKTWRLKRDWPQSVWIGWLTESEVSIS